MTAKIENYETYKGTISADTFTFPHNPNTLTMDTDPFIDRKDLPYAFTFLGWNRGIKSRQVIGLNGHFDGTTRNSDYQNLQLNFNDFKLKKLYFAADKFYIGRGVTVQKTPSGVRPNHIDYVATFLSPFGILFDNTQKSGLSNSAEKNEGNVETPIEQITGSVTSGQVVHIEDKNGNGIEFTASATGTFTLYLIYVTTFNNDQYIVEYLYGEIGGTKQVLKQADTSGNMLITLQSDESLNTLFTGGTISNITPTFKFRDGHTSE